MQEPLPLSPHVHSYSSTINSTNCRLRSFKNKQSDHASSLLKTLQGLLSHPEEKHPSHCGLQSATWSDPWAHPSLCPPLCTAVAMDSFLLLCLVKNVLPRAFALAVLPLLLFPHLYWPAVCYPSEVSCKFSSSERPSVPFSPPLPPCATPYPLFSHITDWN